MFGGLSIKGDSKEESAAPAAAPSAAPNSGFSFLQSSIGASAPPAAVDDAAASEPPAAATSAPAGSAFGFMSSGGASADSKEEAAPTPAQPSMFAGLSTPSATGSKAPEPAAAAPPNDSGFSFMSSMSSAAPVAPAPTSDAINSNNADAASTTSTAGSSFSFMASMTGSAMGSEIGEPTKDNGEGLAVVQEKDAAAGDAGGMSGFSFLGAPAPPSEMASPAMDQPPPLIPETLQTTAAPTLAVSAAPAPAPVDLMSVTNATLPTGSGVSWSAPPMGMGMGGTPGVTSKKVVKKKRGKRVGVGNSATTSTTNEMPPPSSIPEPAQPSGSFQPPVPPAQTMGTQAPVQQTMPQTPQTPSWGNQSTAHQMPATPSSTSSDQLQLPESPPMRIKAERAMDKADEFIREKQRKSAIALAAERAMQDKSGNGQMQRSPSTEGWKMNNNEPKSPKDSTYQAAKAAAEEAQKLAPAKGKTSLFSNFFHRKGGSNPSAAHGDISTYSSHGGVIGSPAPPVPSFQRGGSSGSAGSMNHGPLSPMHEKTMEVSMYGSPRSLDDETVVAGQEDMQREMELERQRMEQGRQQAEQRRLEEAAAAERRRMEQQKEQERLEQERLEAEKRKAPREKLQSILDTLADTARTSTENLAYLRSQRSTLVERRIAAESRSS